MRSQGQRGVVADALLGAQASQCADCIGVGVSSTSRIAEHLEIANLEIAPPLEIANLDFTNLEFANLASANTVAVQLRSPHNVDDVTDTFFAVPEMRSVNGIEVEWFTPTDHCRGPWDAEACHAGPPTGLLVRAMERALPNVRLARITVDLAKPVPMAGFRIESEVTRHGRTVGATRAAIIDVGGVVRATAIGIHIATQDEPMLDGPLDNSGLVTPKLNDATPGVFPIRPPMRHGLPGFSGSAVRMRYPPGETPDPGATTAWMNTDPLLPDESPSPFQRICPLADCGNAFSRHTNPDEVMFMNPDLTIALHRDPVGEWLGSRTVSQWQPTGIGLADAALFDDDGLVGRALQTMILRRSGALR